MNRVLRFRSAACCVLFLLSAPFLTSAFTAPSHAGRRHKTIAAAQFVPDAIEEALSKPRVSKEYLRRLVFEALADQTLELKGKDVELKGKDVELKGKDVELERASSRLNRLTSEVLRLKGMLDMRGAMEEIIDSLRPEVDINPWGSWTEKEWDQVLSSSRWQPLKVAVAEAGGWKPTWVAGKLDTMWHSLSARAHDVRTLQGLEREAVIISAKVLSGEECRALGLLCHQFNIPFVYDGTSGYLDRGDLAATSERS